LVNGIVCSAGEIKMRNLLYITYHFPPTGGSGVQRGLKFAKYLPQFGFRPIILCADYRCLKQPKDYTLLKELPSSVKIYRTFTLDLNWFFKLLWGLKLNKVVTFFQRCILIPDTEVLWLPFAFFKLKKILATNHIDLVLITAPPYSPLLLAKYLIKHHQLKVCVDFRDPWSFGIGRKYLKPPSWIATKENNWEKDIITLADKIICVNDKMVDEFRRLYTKIPADKFCSITNGYDESDFQVSLKTARSDKLNIVYTGSFYDSLQPQILWQALLELIDKGDIDPHKIAFHIYGKNSQNFVLGKYQQDNRIRSMVHFYGYVDHKYSIRILQTADLLLLYSGYGKAQRTLSPAKIYEYLRSGKPVFAIIDPESSAADILLPANTIFLANSASLISIKNTLSELYTKWKHGNLKVEPNWDYIRKYERKALTYQLAEVLSSIT
jgi:glycosyltransferase involved in cell wall biosynthesis